MPAVSINGQAHPLPDDPRTTLLDFLQQHLTLTGTKKGCDHGQCGACTVLVDGERMNSCLLLACQLDGCEITTIEGIGSPNNLHPVQRAFLQCDAFQCGFCTSGQICSSVAMQAELSQPSTVWFEPDAAPDEDIKERLSGNLCRCGAYANIVAAVKQAGVGESS